MRKSNMEFGPDQDMMDVSPEDVAEAKRRAASTKAFNESSKTPPAPAGIKSLPAEKRPMRPAKPASGATAMKKGGMVSSASKRADGCAQRGKTKGRMV